MLTLILHQSDQRRNNNTQTVPHEGRDLVAQRLATYNAMNKPREPPVGIRITTSNPFRIEKMASKGVNDGAHSHRIAGCGILCIQTWFAHSLLNPYHLDSAS